MMQRVATRARALGLLAACALAQSTSQPDLLIIIRHFAEHAGVNLVLVPFLSAVSRWRDGCIAYRCEACG